MFDFLKYPIYCFTCNNILYGHTKCCVTLLELSHLFIFNMVWGLYDALANKLPEYIEYDYEKHKNDYLHAYDNETQQGGYINMYAIFTDIDVVMQFTKYFYLFELTTKYIGLYIGTFIFYGVYFFVLYTLFKLICRFIFRI